MKERRKWEREIRPFDKEDEDGEAEDFFADVADTRDEIGAFEDRETFRAILAMLPERERKILRLYYREGFSLRAIGAKLNMTENHAAVIKARAMKKLRAVFGVERARRQRKEKRRPRKGRR